MRYRFKDKQQHTCCGILIELQPLSCRMFINVMSFQRPYPLQELPYSGFQKSSHKINENIYFGSKHDFTNTFTNLNDQFRFLYNPFHNCQVKSECPLDNHNQAYSSTQLDTRKIFENSSVLQCSPILKDG